MRVAVAYSFQRRFVAPICTGLGREIPAGFFETIQTDLNPKRQTIRADRKRHVRPGEVMQLYFGLRTRQCFLIGKARCTSILSAYLNLETGYVTTGGVRCMELDCFAKNDGFQNWAELREFWRVHHPGVEGFEGVIIYWEPIT